MKCLNVNQLIELKESGKPAKWHPDYRRHILRKNADELVFIKYIKNIKSYINVEAQGELGGLYSRDIRSDGRGFNTGDPMFIYADHQEVENTKCENLKVANSRPEATRCAKCGGPLKEPFFNIKFCPVCEP